MIAENGDWMDLGEPDPDRMHDDPEFFTPEDLPEEVSGDDMSSEPLEPGEADWDGD